MVRSSVITTNLVFTNCIAEHIIEIQTIPMFFEFLNTGQLPSGTVLPGFQVLYPEDLSDLFFKCYFKGVPSFVIDGSVSHCPDVRLMDVLGSFNNWRKFKLLRKEINRQESTGTSKPPW